MLDARFLMLNVECLMRSSVRIEAHETTINLQLRDLVNPTSKIQHQPFFTSSPQSPETNFSQLPALLIGRFQLSSHISSES
jgi:hypothetical protein